MILLRTQTNADLFVLTKKDLDEVLSHYPQIRKEILETAEERQNMVKQRAAAAAAAKKKQEEEDRKKEEDRKREEEENKKRDGEGEDTKKDGNSETKKQEKADEEVSLSLIIVRRPPCYRGIGLSRKFH